MSVNVVTFRKDCYQNNYFILGEWEGNEIIFRGKMFINVKSECERVKIEDVMYQFLVQDFVWSLKEIIYSLKKYYSFFEILSILFI